LVYWLLPATGILFAKW